MTTPPVPPDNRAPGQSGHITDHNEVSDALTALQNSVGSSIAVRGTATMASGTVTVSNSAVQASSLIFLTGRSGVTGALRVTTVTAGVSFVITSSVGTDAGVVNWWIAGP